MNNTAQCINSLAIQHDIKLQRNQKVRSREKDKNRTGTYAFECMTLLQYETVALKDWNDKKSVLTGKFISVLDVLYILIKTILNHGSYSKRSKSYEILTGWQYDVKIQMSKKDRSVNLPSKFSFLDNHLLHSRNCNMNKKNVVNMKSYTMTNFEIWSTIYRRK